MIKLLKSIIKIILLIVFLVCVMTGIDYYRMYHGEIPIFNTSYYNSRTRTQTYKGVFYVATREYYASIREPLEDSRKLRFYLFSFSLPIPEIRKKQEVSFQVETKEQDVCGESSVLYYADLDKKVYLYCLDDISINDQGKKDSLFNLLSKDNGIIDKTLNHMDFMGIYLDQSTLMFQSGRDNISNNGLKIFQCNSFYVNDIYIGPKSMAFHDDFCTYKDDDFKFIYDVVDESPESIQPVVDANGKEIPEVFFEDDKYRYEFEVPKSAYVFVTTPAVRGKDATKTPLLVALSYGLVTIEDLEEKGLKFNKIDKAKELDELLNAQQG